jgi:predicted dehydrogenase
VTSYLEFPNGATGMFITSTGEAPGTNRLEISAEKGNLVYEKDRVLFTRNKVGMSEFSRNSKEGFAKPETEEIEITAKDHGPQHNGILRNFADAILDGAPLIAPAADGIRSVELANAMLLSTWENKAVSLPLDGKRYEKFLNQQIAASKKRKSSSQK